MLSDGLRLMQVFHDMKQTELAPQLGITNSHLSEIESGRKQPTLALIDRYSSVFGIPRSSILFFAESLETPERCATAAQKGRGVIARKVIHFLRLIENCTKHAEEN